MENLKMRKKIQFRLLIFYLLVLAMQIVLIFIYRKAEVTFSFKGMDMGGFEDILAGIEIEKDGAFLIGKPMSFAYVMASTLSLEKIPFIFGMDIITLAFLMYPLWGISRMVSFKDLSSYRNFKVRKTGFGGAIICFGFFLITAFITANNSKKELGKLSFSFNAFGHLYWIFLLVQFILVIQLSRRVEGYLFYRDKEVQEGE